MISEEEYDILLKVIEGHQISLENHLAMIKDLVRLNQNLIERLGYLESIDLRRSLWIRAAFLGEDSLGSLLLSLKSLELSESLLPDPADRGSLENFLVWDNIKLAPTDELRHWVFETWLEGLIPSGGTT